MKLKIVIALALLFIFPLFIIGCQGEKLSVSEILSKSIEATAEVESSVYEIEIDQNTALPFIEAITMNYSSTNRAIIEPLTIETTMNFIVAGEQSNSLTLYQTENIVYVGGLEAGWVYQEIKEGALLLEAPDDPFMFIDMLQEVGGKKNIKIEKENDSYLLTYEDVGGDLARLMKEQIEKQLKSKLANDPELEDFLANTIISDLKYVLSIDSVTFLPIENTFAVTLTTEVMGEKLIVDQEMRIKYLEYNTLDTIDIPDEVINEAIPADVIFLTSFAMPENRLYEYAAINYFEVENRYTDDLNDLGYAINLGAANRSSSLENTPVINTLTLENQAYHTSVIPISDVITADNLEILYLSLKFIDKASYIVGGAMIIAGVATAPVTIPAITLAVATGVAISVGIELVGLAAEKMKCAELTYGTIEWRGGTYTGDIKDCKPHGQGSWTSASGDQYVGEYRDGSRYYGTYTWPSGDKFEGEFKDGSRYYGTYTWPSGAKFEGEFRNERRYRGVYTYPSGKQETITP